MDLKGKNILVTGGAGFIGSHAVDRLVAEGAKVTVVDDLSGGNEAFLAAARNSITFVRADCGDAAVLDRLLPGMDSVWHLAANPDVRTGESDPAGHYHGNVELTFRGLEGMRRHGVGHLAFTSTSTVYGTASVIPTPEDYGPLLPISIYGACKLAGEALISAYGATFGIDALLFRFANVVGPRSTHGVVFDFVRKLRRDPARLEILGDGRQTKSYVSVADTVDAMVHAARHAPHGVHPYNIGSKDAIPVVQLADTVANVMGVRPKHRFAGGTADGAGWKGDVKAMRLALGRLAKLGPGWAPRHSSEDAVRIAAEAVAQAR
ncbi:MAG: NAD-dependent epimerase/dehydratase family protein [Thermoplasmatota archaeon]